MTPHEKALNAVNHRLERLRVALLEAQEESARRFLFQALVVTLGLGEALNDYMKMVGAYAQRRHGELKQANEVLGVQHAELLQSGKQLLEKLKANPTDRALRKEIEVAQQGMAAIQKTVRRGTNALQREIGPSVAMIDKLAESVRRLSETDDSEALKRVLKTLVGHVSELYTSHPTLTAQNLIDVGAWEKSVVSEIDQATDRYDSYARAVYQALIALELMTSAVSENPPVAAEEATSRANEAVALRVKEIAGRFAAK